MGASRIGHVVCLAGMLVATATSAHAESVQCAEEVTSVGVTKKGDEIAAGKLLFTKGLSLQSAGKIGQACRMFEASLLLAPQSGSLLNVADCREASGRLVEAHALFAAAAREAEKAGDRRAEFARQRRDALVAKLVTVTVNVAEPTAAGQLIRVAGCPLNKAEATIRRVAMPGVISVDVSIPGRRAFRTEQVGAAGETVVIDVPLPPIDESDPDAMKRIKEAEARVLAERLRAEQMARELERSRTYDQHPLRKVALVGGAVGLATLATGVIFGVSARRAQTAFDNASCGDRTRLLLPDAFAECADYDDRGQRNALLANTFLIGGSVMFAASAVVYLLDPGNVERPSQPASGVSFSGSSVQLTVPW